MFFLFKKLAGGGTILSLITAYHKFNRFLGTLGGDLLKQSLELILLFVIVYMLVSEYRKEKLRELKFLIIGFSLLLAEKIMMSFILSQIVFVDIANIAIVKHIPVISNFLEITALVIITNVLLCDLYKTKFRRILGIELAVCLFAFVIFEWVWVVKQIFFPDAETVNTVFFVLFEIAKLVILGYPIFYLIKNRKLKMQAHNDYYTKVAAAFLIYAVTPLLSLANYVLFSGAYKPLRIITHPFPFLAMLLLLRVIFVKLADKAMLKKELEITQKKYEQTKKISQMKDEFVSTINHELRTPITSMKLYISLMLNEKMGRVNEKQKKALEIMDKESTRLGGLINDILDMSKLESKKTALNLQKCELGKLLDYEPYKKMIEEKKITVIKKIPKNFTVEVDENKFRQVFVNLLSNAVKYGKENGKIILEASAEKNRQKGQRGKQKDSWSFWVQDDGIGIKKEHQKKIFDKFYQAEDYLTRKKGGTGLGLPIAKKIVELHGGTIKVESAPGRGSRFIVTIPFMPKKSAGLKPQQ